MTTKKYKSEVSETIHKMASSLHKAGVMSDEEMGSFDASFLVPDEPMTAREIKSLRKKLNLSQSNLGAVLSVKTNTVSKWEQGLGKPTGPANRLLHVIERKGIGFLVA